MSEPGKPRFAALESLTSQVSKSDEKKLPSAPVTSPVQDDSVETAPTIHKQIERPQSKPRITKQPLSPEMEQEIFRIATQIAERAVVDKLYGRRQSFKGPRVTRSYKIDIHIDKWLDAISNETGIEKSTMVTNAIREYIQDKYAHLEPEEIPQETGQ